MAITSNRAECEGSVAFGQGKNKAARPRHRSMKIRGSMLLLVWVVLCALVAVASAHGESSTSELAVVSTDNNGDAAAADNGPVVRCRICGAKVALNKDYMELHDTTKSVSVRHTNELGKHGAEIHTFVNPSRVEMELVAFKHAVGVEGDGFTSKATFFDGYSWKDFRCGGCNRHVGWKFHHDDFQQCIHSSIMESVSAKAQEDLQSATAEQQAKKKELARKELEGQCVTASAGWWSYEVCYGKEVRQFHEEADGTRPSDWSMGVYVEENSNPGALAATLDTEIVQSFERGQHCDENGELRKTKVVYTCCKSMPTTVTIEDVAEPSLCSYVITVCVPSLCAKSSKPDVPYDSKVIASKCDAEFHTTHENPSIPSSFAALRWSTVISEDSSELDWARAMHFKT